MNKKLLVYFIIPFCLSTGAFAQDYFHYTANMLHVPALSRKGDFEFTLGRSFGGRYKALEVQAAYGFWKRCLVSAEYFDAGSIAVRKHQYLGTDARMGVIGFGLYEHLPHGAASLIAGFGSGRWYQNYNVGTDLRDSQIDLQRWFIQPGLTYKSETFYANMAMRLSRVHFQKGKISLNAPYKTLGELAYIQVHDPWFLPEIGLQAGIVIKIFTLSMGGSVILPNTKYAAFNKENFAVMLHVNL